MQIILLSGGSGKRLWPLSNEVRSKQFLKILRKEDGSHESMVQRMHRMILEADQNAEITFATSQSQAASVKAQLGEKPGISIEPDRKDTFPAIALASAYLHDVKGISEEETAVVCPVDSYADAPYFQKLTELDRQAGKGEANLVLMGVEPTYPSDKYGYIIPQTGEPLSFVKEFKEKPDAFAAEGYLKQGALWNAGVFAYKLKYVLHLAAAAFGTAKYQELSERYADLPPISFDYAVVEREPKIQVMRFSGEWKHLGDWNSFTEVMHDGVAGNAVAVECENTHVINELQIPLIALGTKELAIAATPDGILVADKQQSAMLKEYVTDQRPMYEKRIWGEYQVLDYRIQSDGQNFLTKHLAISPGQHISYQRHRHRTEIWTFVDGTGKLILDGKVTKVSRGDTAYIQAGVRHAIKAESSELHIIEVQVGDELTEEDIERLEWDWSQDEL